MKDLIESIRQMYQPRTEATMMKNSGEVVHNCAKHVEHAQYGKGKTIAEEHADPDRYGNIAWYDVMFEHGIERGMPVAELSILQSESHGHATKKAKKMAEEEDYSDMGKKKVKGKSEDDEDDDDKNEKDDDDMEDDDKPMKGKKKVMDEEVDETISYRATEYDITEAKKDSGYDAHFRAMMAKHGVKHPGELDTPEKKKAFFNKVDASYKAKNEEVFLEAMMASDLDKIKDAHRKAGNRISDEKSGSKAGQAHHSFVVTQPSGKRTRHIYHGSTKKLETMSPAPRSKESSEQDLDDK
jgi:hypothetical protein